MSKRLQGKTAIVNGGTSGIGEAAVRRFVAEGAKVVFSGRRAERGNEIVSALGGQATFVQGDATVRADLEKLLKTGLDTLGKIDIVFNNAGIAASGPYESFSMEMADKIFNTNFRSYFEFNQMVIPHMLENGGGSIINNASCGGIRAGAYLQAYCATKAAVISLTKSTAIEYASRGIRCNAVCPGCITTDMAPAGGPFEERMMMVTPMKRPGTVEEIASGLVYLASDEAVYVTGTTLSIDGGVTA